MFNKTILNSGDVRQFRVLDKKKRKSPEFLPRELKEYAINNIFTQAVHPKRQKYQASTSMPRPFLNRQNNEAKANSKILVANTPEKSNSKEAQFIDLTVSPTPEVTSSKKSTPVILIPCTPENSYDKSKPSHSSTRPLKESNETPPNKAKNQNLDPGSSSENPLVIPSSPNKENILSKNTHPETQANDEEIENHIQQIHNRYEIKEETSADQVINEHYKSKGFYPVIFDPKNKTKLIKLPWNQSVGKNMIGIHYYFYETKFIINGARLLQAIKRLEQRYPQNPKDSSFPYQIFMDANNNLKVIMLGYTKQSNGLINTFSLTPDLIKRINQINKSLFHSNYADNYSIDLVFPNKALSNIKGIAGSFTQVGNITIVSNLKLLPTPKPSKQTNMQMFFQNPPAAHPPVNPDPANNIPNLI